MLTKSSEFDTWFSGSAITREDGSPMVLYHGSGTVIDSPMRAGTFFSPRPDVAAIYAKAPTRQVPGGGPNITPVFLSIKNPYVFDDLLVNDNLSHHVLGKRGRIEQVIEALISQGFDGIHRMNYDDLGGVQDQYVIFSSLQVRCVLSQGNFLAPPTPPIDTDCTGAEEIIHHERPRN